MRHSKEDLKQANLTTAERIISTVNAGVKIRKISDKSGITYFRIASVVNVSSYRYKSSFTMKEIRRIHKALDCIKEAI